MKEETNNRSVFEVLNAIDCNEHVEKKNDLSYLSWAWAWQIVKKNYPDAFYTIYENASGLFYHTDGKTCWVKTGVTINGLEHIEYLPVMDFKNKSIPLNAVTSFDVNKAIQRSLTKAAARHGLGLYIYAGEDLPEDAKVQKAEKEAAMEDQAVNEMMAATSNEDIQKVWNKYKQFTGDKNGRFYKAAIEMGAKYPRTK